MLLEVKNITKKYDKKIILDDVSINIEKGINILLGCNGSGKTTFINILTGLDKANDGYVNFDGKDILIYSCEYRKKLGYLPQECEFYDNYTAYDFVKYIAHLKGISVRDQKDRIEEYLQLFNLWEIRNKKIATFSGGMKHRLGIAQALLNRPDVLILDEPTTGLDYKEIQSFKKIIKDYSKQHIVLLSTHIINDVDDIFDKAIFLKDSKLQIKMSSDIFSLDDEYCKFIDGT